MASSVFCCLNGSYVYTKIKLDKIINIFYNVGMYIAEVPTRTKAGKLSHLCVLLRQNYRDPKDKKKVRGRTIANLTHCRPEEIAAIKFALKHKKEVAIWGREASETTAPIVQHQQGLSVGAAWVVYAIAQKTGLEKVLGTDRQGKLALWQVLARVINQGSRLSAVRLAQVHAIADVLGVREGFCEDQLYRNLAWLTDQQKTIEKRLFNISQKGRVPELFLYDVTSSYFEGTDNELAEFGYNRDRKRGKQQVVVGLLCDDKGEPVSVEVFRGNTKDTETVEEQIAKLVKEYGCERATFVGDRGMVKQGQIKELNAFGYHYITAITKPQIQKLLREEVFQLELFTKDVCEIEHEGLRYLLRRNPERAKEMTQTRQEKETVIAAFLERKNQYLKAHPRAKVEISRQEVIKKIKQLKVDQWLMVENEGRQLKIKRDETSLAGASLLDGCYVLKTDLPAAITKEIVHTRYKDLTLVEEAFRMLKTVLLEMRPWYVRTEESTRGHALIAMLAFLIVRQLKAAWSKFDVTVEEGLGQLSLITSNIILIQGKAVYQKIALPGQGTQKLLTAAGVILPEALPCLGANVVSRKKLTERRKRR